jgi:hypothetical protein
MVSIVKRKTKTEVLLHVIESIVGDDFCEDLDCMCAFHPEEMTQREKDCQTKLSLIYRVVHSLNQMHSCHGVHNNWRKEFRRMRHIAEEEMANDAVRKVRHPGEPTPWDDFKKKLATSK